MRKFFGYPMGVIVAALAAVLLSGCGYNDLQRQDEQIKSAWSEVLNQYQRRADLVPNLVNTVKGYAAQEERVLTEVTNARASVGRNYSLRPRRPACPWPSHRAPRRRRTDRCARVIPWRGLARATCRPRSRASSPDW